MKIKPEYVRATVEFIVNQSTDDRLTKGEISVGIDVYDAEGNKRSIMAGSIRREEIGTRSMDHWLCHMEQWLFGDKNGALKAFNARMEHEKERRKNVPPPPRIVPERPPSRRNWVAPMGWDIYDPSRPEPFQNSRRRRLR